MCTGFNQGMFDAVLNQTKKEDPSAAVVTGTQTGLINPIDTVKVSKKLKKDKMPNTKPLKKRGSGLSPLDLKIM